MCFTLNYLHYHAIVLKSEKVSGFNMKYHKFYMFTKESTQVFVQKIT